MTKIHKLAHSQIWKVLCSQGEGNRGEAPEEHRGRALALCEESAGFSG